jgi:ABC-type transporter Mla maintaining outer membrane lipid asymmetry ATPase subunit MlaF
VSAGASSLRQASPGAGDPLLEVRGVAKRFGAREVLKSISLDIATGEFLTLLGESSPPLVKFA